MKTFDLVVIGTGAAGSKTAYRCKKAGWEVAIIDEKPFGGTCALRGCDPKKVLVGVADLVDWSRNMSGSGVSGDLSLNWSDLMRFKESFTTPVPEKREEAFSKAGIVTFHGTASFVDQTTIEVNGEKLKVNKNILIATGAKPRDLDIEGKEYLATSEEFLNLKELPRNIIFVGGGYISFEFAHLVSRSGSKATILHRGSRPLESFDPDLVGGLMKATEEAGIKVQLNASVTAVKRKDNGFSVVIDGSDTVTGGLVIHGAGRVPALDALSLESGGIERDRHGVVVNEYFQSVSNSAVYAAGDAVVRRGGFPLTPVASYEGGIVAENMLKGNINTADYSGLASVAFTIPPIAMVGMREDQAQEKGLSFSVHTDSMSEWYSSKRIKAPQAMFKTLVEKDSEKILGAHLLGPHVEETINLFAFAIRHGLTAKQIKEMMWAYPTHASDIGYMV